jgi:hypothetical protein
LDAPGDMVPVNVQAWNNAFCEHSPHSASKGGALRIGAAADKEFAASAGPRHGDVVPSISAAGFDSDGKLG